jgi:hypothetical protein
MANTPRHAVHIRDGDRVVAWVFVGPQDLPGVYIAMGREEQPNVGATLYGELLCGDPTHGGHLIDVEATAGREPDGPLTLGGGDRCDLSRSRCFAVRSDHEVEQMSYPDGAAPWEALSRAGGVRVAVYEFNRWWG